MALTWTQHSTHTGYQIIKATVSGGVANSAEIVKNDGSILAKVADEASFTGIDQQYLSTSTLYVSIIDTETDYPAYFTTNPYTLDYQLVASIVEEISVEGSLSIQGDAQVSVGSGFSYTTDAEGNRIYTMTPDSERYAETCNIQEIIANYNSSMKSTVSSMVSKQSDIATGVSILDRQMLDVLIRLDAGGL